MIPSLLLVKSDNKRLFTLTQKRNITIGTHENADVIVNHPHLRKHSQILGPGSTPKKAKPEGSAPSEPKPKTSFFLPIYTFSIDGLNVRMIHLRVLFSVLLIACFGLATTIWYLTDHKALSTSQDWTSITLPAEGVYGFCRQDRNHSEGVRFSFYAIKSQPYRLVFLVGGKGDGTAISLSLNGAEINKPFKLPKGWGEETSIPLPSAHIVDGSNIVEVRLMDTTTSETNWGISDVRVLPAGKSNTFGRNATVNESESIKNALDRENIGGPELAHYYKTVRSWETTSPSNGSSFDRNSIMEEIEKKMKDKLHQVAFDVRSRNILGDESSVRQLLDETRSWIPEGWLEGWEIYNELCR